MFYLGLWCDVCDIYTINLHCHPLDGSSATAITYMAPNPRICWEAENGFIFTHDGSVHKRKAVAMLSINIGF